MSFSAAQLQRLRRDLDSMMAEYTFVLREVETKLSVLRDEFTQLHDYSPIEHISTRVKSMDSLLAKASRKGIAFDPDEIRRTITDIAGARVTCGFVTDVYEIFDMLVAQDDVTVLKVKDYIKNPKPNGYKSLHAIIRVPVFLSSGRQDVTVEIQFRTSAMDFWASLEHKLHYKYDGDVPQWAIDELKEVAEISSTLEQRMLNLRHILHSKPIRSAGADSPSATNHGGHWV
ncbi:MULTISPECIES: GTP pyrophosphokinase [Auritidibacter]|uniref:GTP pyrophosphokinase n=1 Tax=Auritidibacter TaxID=1160973 RepID=UPI000D73989A|nr:MULTISPECIES: GTP pyrophosphokinase family protein [Auritidibacter]PXA82222.1 GTP pyrophosphokinase [Auritidibacter sp. NML120779]AXR75170.1 GTP pyrophosphokinase family protein [Auritidibacter sp. NML130574]PXA77092.1 GTP pyrophosphokinase [Auritidibacter sp. NML100628]PXA80728.1 GTP pyrophosphokinase [Auritidibacter sp. NML120636]RMX23461.1 GTP pyrophosphokinase family protein [Auritidibacter ignavus]